MVHVYPIKILKITIDKYVFMTECIRYLMQILKLTLDFLCFRLGTGRVHGNRVATKYFDFLILCDLGGHSFM